MVTFGLKIDDDKHSLTKENGIDAEELGKLLLALMAAINPGDGSKCTVSEIRGNCYMPVFSAQKATWKDNFTIVHNALASKKPINDLPKEYAEYARTLKAVLKSNRYVEIAGKGKKKPVKLYAKDLKKEIDTYYTIKTIVGTITEIGTPDNKTRNHIIVSDVSYKIFTTEVQDELLKPHYKNGILNLKIRQKRSSSTDAVVNADLIDFNVRSIGDFITNLNRLKGTDFAFAD